MPPKSNITVAVRIRPLITKEERIRDLPCLHLEQSNTIKVQDPVDKRYSSKTKINNVLHRSREQRFRFDYVFHEDDTTQMIFDSTSKELVEETLKGFNSCIFAYGATGSGKTFTMLGNQRVKGLNEISLQHIFRCIGREVGDYKFDVSASFIEIYNENIMDLLNLKNKEPLHLRDDPYNGLIIANVTSHGVNSIEEVFFNFNLANVSLAKRKLKPNNRSNESKSGVIKITCCSSVDNLKDPKSRRL